MKTSGKPASFFWYLFFAALFSIQILARLSGDSLTNDEPTDITNGYYYWTHGDVVSPHNHPPLGSALQALPLLALNLKTQAFAGDVIDRGHFFIFDWNLGQLGKITVLSRLVSWLFGLGVGFLLWRVTRQSIPWSATTLFFWAFDPAFSALSGLAKTDIAPTFFFLLAILVFEKSRREPSLRNSILAGITAGLAVNAKFYCIILVPLFLVLEFLDYRRKENLLFLKERRIEIRNRWINGAGSFLVTTLLLFLPATLLLPDHHQPFYYLIEKFKEDVLFARNPFPVFFMGSSGLESHWYYLPVAFLLKEPLPFLFALTGGATLALRGVLKPEPWITVPPLLFFLALLPTPNLGIRYLLPAFPFLFLIAGEVLAWMGGSAKGWGYRATVGVLVLWQMGSVALNAPHMIGYFNELVPPGKKIHYLADSNLDWGQDQKRLAEVGRQRGWGKARLAYFGGIDPGAYGLTWEPWSERDLEGPEPGAVYLIDASFLQLAPVAYPSARPIATSWIADATPTGKVGDSWYYFEIPGKSTGTKEGRWLVSAPFLQYRGYAFPPDTIAPSEKDIR